MNDRTPSFAGSVPAVYDRLLVPLIFQPYADDMARRVLELAPSDVLEIAAGTGVVTRVLAPRLGIGSRYTATDISPAMLEVAASHFADDPARPSFRTADALALPFAEASYDVVCCQFGAMFFTDRLAGYHEVASVLRPGGTFVFNVWDSVDRNSFAAAIEAALAEVFPDDPPRFISQLPHGYAARDKIRGQLEGAGFGAIEITPVTAESRADGADTVATAYCQGTPLSAEIQARGGDIERVTHAVAEALARRYGSGPVRGDLAALVVTASA